MKREDGHANINLLFSIFPACHLANQGRDAAGKGWEIRRFTKHLNPYSMWVAGFPKPSGVEQGQRYFRRYIRHFLNTWEVDRTERLSSP
ncbi:MAG: hypothetical protein KC588_01485 [Nitrospira sp.]|nr:hypothetical protein [Nitrospira sp.]